jgi:hypothetical protein
MSDHDLSRLAPADAATTLRSLDRRFRAAVRPVDDPDVEVWAQLPGPDGHSALDHVAAAGRTLTLLHQALSRIRGEEDPYLDEAVLEPDERSWAFTPGDLDVELDALADEAAAMADLVDATPGAEWSRTARIPGPATAEAMDVLLEAVRSSVADLRAAEEAMTEARRD